MMIGFVVSVRQPIGLRNRTQFVYVQDAEVSIGHLVSIHEMNDEGQCTVLIPQEVVRSKAMEFAVGQINKRMDILPNITVGFVELDDCYNELTALEIAVYLINNNFHTGRQLNERHGRPTAGNDSMFSTMVGVLGPLTSVLSVAVSQYLGVFHVPIMAIYATANELSDKTNYPYFMRLVPPDFDEEKVIIEVNKGIGNLYSFT
jgi:Receptor family ligand binding region